MNDDLDLETEDVAPTPPVVVLSPREALFAKGLACSALLVVAGVALWSIAVALVVAGVLFAGLTWLVLSE